MDEQENIERFFDKETSEQERSTIKQKIVEEQDVDANIFLEAGEAIGEEKELSNLRDRLKEIANEEKREPRQTFFPFYKVAASLAILAVVSIIVWMYVPFSTSEDVFDNYFKPYSGVVIVRGENPLPSRGLKHYQAKEFEKALNEFLKETHNKNNKLDLLIANCYLSLGDMENSIIWLNSIEPTESSLILQSRDWYLALALLKMNEIDESKKLLINLIESGSIYKDQASEILNESSYK
jgi:tetratricopeptide (TPR) repeat protein